MIKRCYITDSKKAQKLRIESEIVMISIHRIGIGCPICNETTQNIKNRVIFSSIIRVIAKV